MLGRGSLLAYLVHMTLRIVEIHRVLKPTGSFYLHCDPTASHYLKLICDAVFCGQGGDFLNEIVWHYDGPQRPSKRNFGRKHDIVLRFAKTRDFLAVPSGIAPLERVSVTDLKNYKRTSDGRYYYDLPRGDYTDESIAKLDAAGRIRWTASGKARVMFFLESDGEGNQYRAKQLHDVWSDLVSLGHAGGAEKLGYPTQKPEALLERIIRASSNEGDTVLDAYCGCGTTVAVAQRLGRKWIGIDITYQSIALILKRFADTYGEKWPAIEAGLLLDGVPRDLDSAMALAHRKDDKTRKEFEKWAVLTFSRNQARINDKKGADGGVDGVAYFLKDKGENGKAIFQVKSRPGTREDLAKLNSDRQREGAEFGFLLCTGPWQGPTAAMQREIAAAGKYQNPLLARSDDRLQVVMIAELFAPHNRRLDLPMGRADAVRSAAALGDAAKQAALDL